MILNRLKPVSKEKEEEWKQGMKDANLPFVDILVMIGTAFVVIVIPCLIVVSLLAVFMLWVFGLL